MVFQFATQLENVITKLDTIHFLTKCPSLLGALTSVHSRFVNQLGSSDSSKVLTVMLIIPFQKFGRQRLGSTWLVNVYRSLSIRHIWKVYSLLVSVSVKKLSYRASIVTPFSFVKILLSIVGEIRNFHFRIIMRSTSVRCNFSKRNVHRNSLRFSNTNSEFRLFNCSYKNQNQNYIFDLRIKQIPRKVQKIILY